MAGIRAIMAVSDSVIDILETQFNSKRYSLALEFEHFTAEDFSRRRLNTGVSLYLNQVTAYSTLPPQADTTGDLGGHQYSYLPLEFHFLMTIWAPNASLRQGIARWMVKTLQKTPVLLASELNNLSEGAFRSNEGFELSLGDPTDSTIPGLEITRGENRRSVPYVARMVSLEASALRSGYA